MVLLLVLTACSAPNPTPVESSSPEATDAAYMDGYKEGFETGLYDSNYGIDPLTLLQPPKDTPQEMRAYTSQYVFGYNDGYTDGYGLKSRDCVVAEKA